MTLPQAQSYFTPIPLRVLRLLRITFAIHCLGLGILYLWHPLEQESSIFSVLLFDWNWSEAWAMRLEDCGMWLCVMTGCLLPFLELSPLGHKKRDQGDGRDKSNMNVSVWGDQWKGSRYIVQGLLAFCVVWEVSMSAAAAIRRDNFMAEWSLILHALRIAVPAALFLAEVGASAWILREVLRWGTVMTTVGHGTEALLLASEFSSLILGTGQNLLGLRFAEVAVHRGLRVIGSFDYLAAMALVAVPKWRWPTYAICVWGLITAASRVTANGWLMLPETLIRAVHFGGPLAVAFFGLATQSSGQASELR